MRRAILAWVGVAGCAGSAARPPALDTAVALEAPECAAVSVEPDDGTADDRVSALGLVTDAPRTLCGDIAKASNDGRDYTGDVDYAAFQTIDGGKVRFELDWDGRTDLDLLVYDGNSGEWSAADGRAIELHLDPGFHEVAVAGVDGPPADYTLTAWIR